MRYLMLKHHLYILGGKNLIYKNDLSQNFYVFFIAMQKSGFTTHLNKTLVILQYFL